MTNTGLGFGVLGPLLMTANAVRVSLGPPKQRAVLAMLVINRNRPVSVESLINAVWDQDPVAAARPASSPTCPPCAGYSAMQGLTQTRR
jgi:DNA-binding SARP family transcriptional activator